MNCPYCNGTGKLEHGEVTFGSLILAQRRLRGWSQEELAAEVGFSRGQVANIETNRTDIPLKTLARYATAFGCSMKDLVP